MQVEEPIGARTARTLDAGGILVRRWLGCWIDFVAAAVLFVVCLVVSPDVAGEPDASDVVVVLLGFVLVIAYFTVCEGLKGRTLGKLVTGLVVVDAEGRRPGLGRALVRTLFRLIEVNPFLLGGVPAGIVVMITKDRRRLGDLVAGTYVVPVKSLKAESLKSAAIVVA